MSRNQNGSALPEERGTVDCHAVVGPDIGGDNTQTLRRLALIRAGLSFNRADLIAPLAFGGAHYA
jgi:hypothetical protein